MNNVILDIPFYSTWLYGKLGFVDILVIVGAITTSMDEEKIAERKQVLTGIIRHAYPDKDLFL